MVFVEVEIGGVEKQDLADLVHERVFVFMDLHIEFFRGLADDFPEIGECLRGREVLGLEDDFVFAVLDAVAGGVLDFVLGHGRRKAHRGRGVEPQSVCFRVGRGFARFARC